MRKKLLSWLLVLSMVVSMIPATVLPVHAAEPKGTDTGGVTLGAITESYNVSAQSADIEITAGGTYELTGAKDGISVIVNTADAVVLVLRSLELSNVRSPIQLAANANVTLVLPKGSANMLTCTSATLDDATAAAQGASTAKTAGINVPLGASLTIDREAANTEYGTLTVTGGYGGAGIGGGAGVGLNDTKKGNNASAGGRPASSYESNSMPTVHNWTGTLGQGGRFGNDAESAGSITVNSGKLTIQAGSGAAGIGGGRGADGEAATASTTTTPRGGSESYSRQADVPSSRMKINTSDTNQYIYVSSGGPGTGGASGANGGTGGDAGDGGTVVITGGELSVTGSEAPGIGGGKPGAGGSASSGNGGSAAGNINYWGHNLGGSNGGRGQDGYSYAGKNGNGGSLEIKGGKLTATGTVSVGAGPVGSFTGGGNHNAGRGGDQKRQVWSEMGRLNKSFEVRGAAGGWGGAVNAPERKTGTAAIIKINGSTDNILLPDGWDGNSALTTRPEHVFAGGSIEKLYKTEITVTRLDGVTKCADAELNLVLHRGNGAKQYTYSARTNAEGVATLWLPVSSYNSREKDVKTAYELYAEGTEVSHRAVGRIMPGLAFGIEVKNNDNNKTTISIGVDFDASSSPNASKVYRSVDSETYELSADDTRGVVDLVIDGGTVPVDMDITRLRWFREKINGNNQEYDYQQIGDKIAFEDGYKRASATNRADSKGENGAQTIDMTPETAVDGKKPRVWHLPMKENGRYWVELTYQAPGEAEQRIVKGVVINNLYTSYPLWVHGRYVLDKDPTTAVMWFYGGENEVVPLRAADNQTWTTPYGIPWDLDGYDPTAVKNNDVTPEQATLKILAKDKILPSDQAGVIGGYDTVEINIIDRYLTFYNASVGNDGDTNVRYNLNKGAKDTPLPLTLNADFFSNQTTRYGEIVSGKQLFNRFLLTYIARDGALNIVFVTGVDEAGKELWNTVNMYTPDIKDATINAWDRPGYILSKVEYTGSNNWIDITNRKDADNAANAIITDLDKMTAYFANVQDVKQLKFTYKKATTDVTIKAFYQLAEGETTEREVEGFVPYPVEATYGKPYTPKGAPTIPGFTYANKSNLKADGTIDVVDPSTLTAEQRANANVIKYYYVKETGNVTYRAVVKNGGPNDADLTVWSEDKTVERNTAPATAAAGTFTPPTLTNYVISGANGNESITRKDNGNPATVYDGLHDLYVTYEYVQKTKDITVQAIDVLTTKEIKLDEADKKVTGLPTGEYKDISAPDLTAKGYAPVGAKTQQCFVDAKLDNQTVTFFYKPTENAETTVTLYYMDGEVEKTIQVLSNEVAWGSSLKVPAPTLAGYTLVVPQDGLSKETLDSGDKYFVTLNPLRGENGAGATGTTAKIQYTKNAPTNVTVKLVDGEGTDLSKLLTGWTGTIEVEEGKSATATAPSIPNYKLAGDKNVKQTLKWAAIKAAVDANQTPTITFTYEKAEADLITITVNGVTEGGEPLYTHTKDVRKSSTEVSLDIITINSYALKDVKMGENEIKPDTTGVYKIDPAGEAKTVTATYQDNMTTVTIHGYYKGSQEKVFPDITVKAELGKRYEYPRPVITGYDTADAPNTTPGVLDSVTAGAEITFYYVKAEGNVTYQAQAEGVVLASKTVTAAVGDTIDKTDEKAAQVFAGGFPYFELTAGSGDATAATYNGKDDVTVTYTYTRKQQQLTIVKKDVDGEAKIADPDQVLTLPAGKLHTFGADEVTGVTGYSAVAALNPKTHAMGDADEQVVFWYRKNVENRYATITVNSVCDENGDNVAEVFQSYQLPALKDVELSVNAPTWTGYKLKDPAHTKETVKPTGNQTITFEYVLDAARTITVELNDNSNPGTPLNAPAGYQTQYTLKKGGSVTIQAPAINGYSLVGTSIVTVNYDTALTGEKVVFNYAPVETANFVNHTVVFTNHNETIEFYRYSTLVSKSDSANTTYKAATVENVIAGYKLKDIRMKVEGETGDSTATTQVTAPNNKNVTIVYRFEEDTSRIVIKKELSDGQTVADTVLSGYRTGLKDVEVTAPLVDGYALAADESLTKKINELVSGENVITFKYDKVGNVTFTLKEHNDETGQDEVIVVRNGVLSKTYDPSEPNNPLNLSNDKYTFVASKSATPPFDAASGKVTVNNTSTKQNYDVYYTKGTRAVQFVAIDSDKYRQPADMTQFDAAAAKAADAIIAERDLTERARVGEMYKASAQSVDRYALDDQITKYYTVEDSTETLCVYFWYRAKKAGTVTVHYHTGLTADNHDKAALLMSYSLDAVVGEKVIIKLPKYLMDGKYKLPDGAAQEQMKTVAEGDNVVDINYEPNFVTVNVMTKRSDFQDSAEYESHEVILTDMQGTSTGNLTLTPPYRAGYTLVGIDGVTGGGVDQFPATYQDGKLTLRGLNANTTITYYYSKTSATEYQSNVTVQYKYGKYDLEPQKVQSFNRDVESSVSIPVFDGYVAKQYQFTDGADAGAKQDIAEAVNIRPTAEKGELVIFYARKDNSAVVPGKDEKIPSPDDVVIKPNGTNIPTVDEVTGNVTVPDGGEVVVPGVGVIVPPNGSIVKPDGTIVAPGTDGGTDSGVKIDPAKPGGTTGYISVTYHANGGEGESYTQMAKDGQSITLIAVADRFKKSGFKGTGWNANDKGLGVPYAAKSITDKSLVLYAQWQEDKDPTTDPNQYKGTIMLVPNGGNGANETINVSSNTANPILHKLPANTFTLEGWTFAYWLDDNGKVVKDTEIVEVADKTTLTLTAQWFSKNADGSITVPGGNGVPGDTDDVTAKHNPNPGEGEDGSLKRDPDTGVITVPNGGSVIDKDGTEIAMPNGGTVKPDGTIVVKDPKGDITIKPDGSTETEGGKTVYTLTYKSGVTDVKDVKVYYTDSVTVSADAMTREGYKLGQWLNGDKPVAFNSVLTGTQNITELTAKWYKVNVDGSVTVPGKDGSIDPDNGNDNVTVKPGEGGKTPDVDDSGKVTVPDNGNGTGTVVTPDGELVVPGGSKVDPDGTITDSDGTKLYPTKGEDGQDKTPVGYIKITYTAGIQGIQNVFELVKGTSAIVAGNPFKVEGKTFIGWDNAKVGDTVTADTVLVAQWKTTGSVVLSIKAGSNVQTMDVDGQKEYVLVMRGSWTGKTDDKTYTIPVHVDGVDAVDGDLRWYVDASSYKTEFGFTRSILTGDEIVSVNAQTGVIKVRNSGIVRIWCESMTDPSVKFSVIFVVPGDFNQDGYVDGDDVDMMVEVATNIVKLTDSKEDFFKKLLGDLDKSAEIDGDDVDLLVEIATYIKEI